MSPQRQALAGLIVGIVGVVAAAGMGVALVAGDDDDEGAGAGEATEEGFFVEPAGSLGPDAFTPSFAVGGSTICDKAKFLQELQARPDALREWAEVMGISEDQVAAYVDSLTPMVLDSDTKVTNHGLHDGQAYARQSLLEAGTEVLIDPNFPMTGPPPNVPEATTTSSPTPSSPTTTVPGTPTPVARCKCGNPLLPPYQFNPPGTTTPTSTSRPPSTTRPSGTTRPPGTTGTTTTPSTSPPSTEPPSMTTPDSEPPDGMGPV